jgi:hypothetical protein
MTPQSAEELLGTLKQKALSIDDLHERARLSGSTWSRDQLELFLICVDGVESDDAGLYHGGGNSAEDELQAAIIAAVRSFAGKPVTAAQVRSRLPNHFVTTDELVLAIARHAVGLEVFGPKLIRITQ